MKGMWMKFWVVGNWASDFRIFKNYICSKISVILYFFTTFMYMFEINHLYPVFSSLAHLIHRWIHWFTFLHALLNPWTNSLEVNFLKHVIIEYKSWQNVLKSFSVKSLLKTSRSISEVLSYEKDLGTTLHITKTVMCILGIYSPTNFKKIKIV